MGRMGWEMADIQELIGITLTSVDGLAKESRLIVFNSDGKSWVMNHEQDCCESVFVADVIGDVNDIVGTPIIQAYIQDSKGLEKLDADDESFTWTFYRIATIKGTVTIRWYGTSNGYYSEEVSFQEC